jgi:hypothetical protein
LGIVEESGCGKSTTARILLGHIPASSGEIWFGEDRVTARQDTKWRQMRRIIQMIYQDPLGALDRRLKVSYQIEEPLIIHHPELTRTQRQERVASVMADVGLLAHHGDRYPHELSAASASASSSHGRCRSNPNCWSATSRFRHSTCPSRPRFSTSSRTSAPAPASPLFSSATTSRSSARSLTASR